MIKLTRLNGHPIAINQDLVKFAESTPDTMLTLVTGERLIVCETLDVVINQVAEWRAHILRVAWPDGSHAVQVTSGQETLQHTVSNASSHGHSIDQTS